MKSVIGSVGNERVSPGSPGDPSGASAIGTGAEFVLAPFQRAQKKELDEMLDYAPRAVESIIAEGVEKSMTKFNRRAQGLKQEEE